MEKKLNLVVDMGNTLTKIAVIDSNNRVVAQWSKPQVSEEELATITAEYAPARAIVASTRGGEEQLCEALRQRVDYVLCMSPQTAVPIGIDYATPQTLGADRVALAVGAVKLYGAEDMLLVDFGTAITIDVVEGGVFRGGNISLGVGSRFRALHEYTAHLPLCEAAEVSARLGESTRTAIEQGVMRGVLYEIEGYVRDFRAKNPQMRIIFSGGDAKCFVNRIKNAIFANCNMMYIGLNAILEYNAAKEII